MGDIDIDKETYKNYINSSEKKINLISKQYLVKNDTKTNLSYATVKNKNRSCPFLADNKSCNAYNILGKENLSIACSTYPRVVKKLGNLSFIAGELSCPEISKLCLSTPNIKINEFKKNELKNIFNSNKIHTIDIPQDLPERIKIFLKKVFQYYQIKTHFFKT